MKCFTRSYDTVFWAGLLISLHLQEDGGEIGSGVVVIVSAQGADKVSVIAMATDDVIAKGAHAGNLIKALAPIVGGGGGGRPNMAQAGGKNPAGIDELIAKVPDTILEQIG